MVSESSPKKKAAKKKVAPKSAPKKAEEKKSCFVMMPFKDPFDLYYSSIYKPAIEKADLKPVRADDLFRPSVIVSDIWNMIRNADLLIAELTTKNANVFYELGLAHAVGKPVILVSETMDDVPFDLQQLRVILYNKNNPSWGDTLKDEIQNSITEVLNEPIEAVPSIFRKKVESFAPEQDEISSRLEDLESQVRLLRARSARPTSTLSGRLSEIREGLEHIHSEEEMNEFYLKHRRRLPRQLLLEEIDNHTAIPDGEKERLEKEFE